VAQACLPRPKDIAEAALTIALVFPWFIGVAAITNDVIAPMFAGAPSISEVK
jgi:hypothetical protein